MCLKKAVLMIHGFGGGTWENEYLANYLTFNYKYDVYAFTLPKHQQEIISSVNFEEWIEASRLQLEHLIKKYNTVYLVGHSMGGVIASYLATEYKQVKKIVLLAPAFEYLNLKQNTNDLRNVYIPKDKNAKIKVREGLYKDLVTKMLKLPIPTMIQFTRLVKKYRHYIYKIKRPTLIIHGTEDEIVPISSSEEVFEKIIAKKKYITKIEKGKHRLLSSDRQDEISKYISSFLKGGLKWKKNKKSSL
ncbi:MAG: alpha/beta fold hydrolase [Bacilli bacterium]|nr:alpha/beta fold hydrolase [Bacilli bacterium]